MPLPPPLTPPSRGGELRYRMCQPDSPPLEGGVRGGVILSKNFQSVLTLPPGHQPFLSLAGFLDNLVIKPPGKFGGNLMGNGPCDTAVMDLGNAIGEADGDVAGVFIGGHLAANTKSFRK